MNYKYKLSVPYVSAALAMAIAVPAMAQGTIRQSGATLEEIIVTAQRREERLQDVPISITALTQETLTDRRITSASDLATYIPSLVSDNTFGPDNSYFAIRGFTREQRTTASVGVYFADVVAPRGGVTTNSGDGTGPGAFFDLQNVQVLKGPQGTLFGRNTTGGAILLVPQKPTDALEGYLETTAGNYDLFGAQGVLNVPVNDRLRFRFGFDSQKRDGYIKNVSGIGPGDFLDVDYYSLRASMVYDITDSLENYTIVTYSDSSNNGLLQQVYNCNPNFSGGFLPTLSGFAACNQADRQNARNARGDEYTGENSFDNPESTIEQMQIINTTTWEVSDRLTVKNIISYSTLESWLRAELFGNNFLFPDNLSPPVGGANYIVAVSDPVNASGDQWAFTEEFQLQGNALDERLQWQTGIYIEISKADSPTGTAGPSSISCTSDYSDLTCLDSFRVLTGSPNPIGRVNTSIATNDFRNLGAYAQTGFALTEQLTLTTGIRYTVDKTEGWGQQYSYVFDDLTQFAGPTRFFCLNSSTPLPIDPRGTDLCTDSQEKTSKEPTWVIGLDYKPSDNMMVYGKYSRGYRQGSTVPVAPVGFRTYEPESVDTFEIGLKTSFEGAVPGNINVAAFYNDFTDQQVQAGFLGKPGVTSTTGIVNAGKSKIQGVELESQFLFFDALNLALSYAYIDTELEELNLPVPDPDGPYAMILPSATVGGPLARSPKNSLTASLTYALPVPEAVGDVSVGLTYTYTDEQEIATDITLESSELFNLNLNWSSIGGSAFDASLFVTNLKDELYVINEGTRSLGFSPRLYGPPRMYGIRVRYNFGS